MTNENAIIARLAGLEVLASGCLVLLLASAGNDPDLSKAKAILDTLQAEGEEGWAHLPSGIHDEAKVYLSDILNRVLTNVRGLRGMPSGMQ